ncbi:MAG: transglycosylase domain-containing protein [Chloroflexota bacterium]|nr:transglycosylase domain-containing protein [Chloroflexota bacterium]
MPPERNAELSRRLSLATRLAIRSRRRNRGEQVEPARMRGWMIALVLLLGVPTVMLGAAAGAAYLIYSDFANDLAPPDRIEETQRLLGSSRIFDRNGEDGVLLFEYSRPSDGLRAPVRLHGVSQHIVDATVATEDSSFWTNQGINLRGLLRAAWENFGVGSSEFLGGSGGSSITQQLVKNVLIPPEERTGRTMNRIRGKLKETILAVELTDEYSKEQILEWYLNSIYYGNFSYGIGAASQRYFGKAPAQLTLAESAMLAGLPQAPSLFNPLENLDRAKQRQLQVLELMVRHGYISQSEADAAWETELQFETAEFDIEAPHYVLYVREQVEQLCRLERFVPPSGAGGCENLMDNGGLRIRTSLDFALQERAEVELRAAISEFEASTGAHNGALVAIDTSTGQILAMVGSRDFFDEKIDGQVNLATATHSPGSALKPLTYLAAFQIDPRTWHPATVLWDVRTTYVEADGTEFRPVNFDGVFRGPVTVRSALANSMNVPAFKVAERLGSPALLDTMHQLGITTMHDPGSYGPSITLGGGEVSLLDMTYAYATLANGGEMKGHPTVLALPDGFRKLDPVAVLEIRDAEGRLLYEWSPTGEAEVRLVAQPGQVYQITDILSDNQARALLYGTDSPLLLDRPAAAKTGTAGDPEMDDVRRDYWTMGYTPQLAVGVWIGNADESPMTGGSSVQTAGLIWSEFMLAAHAGLESEEFLEPEGMHRAMVYTPQVAPLWAATDSVTELRNPCALPREEVFVSIRVAPPVDNHICYEVEVDRRTLQRATVGTPESFLRQGVWLEPPTVARGSAAALDPVVVDWLRRNRVAYLQPGTVDEALAPVRLDSPDDGAVVRRGTLVITGRADSGDLLGWSLVATRLGSDEPVTLASGDSKVQGGVLGRWQSDEISSGVYSLRLEVNDAYLGTISHEIVVALPDESSVAELEEALEDAKP